MKIKQTICMASVLLTILEASFLMGGCSTVPKPAEANGSSRVPANDAMHVQALQQRVNADRQLLLENNLLRAQVDVLQTKLNEMVTIVREALALPPAPKVGPAPVPVLPSPANAPQSLATPELPHNTYPPNTTGVVIRVFYRSARTEFEPSEQVAQALLSSVHGADSIELSGHTSGNVINPINKQIAIERARKAREWLINNGVEATKIHTKYSQSGNFLAVNRTSQGRSINRRVEIDIRNQ